MVKTYIFGDSSKKYDKVVHFADLHLRASERHGEFIHALSLARNILDEYIELNVLIVLVGDLFDSAQKIKPETYPTFRKLIGFLLEIGDVLLIAGNHCMIENSEKMDTISAFMEIITGESSDDIFDFHYKNNSIYYLKYTGLYIIGNLTFALNSLIDGKFYSHSIFSESCLKVNRNPQDIIALYHGCLIGCVNDSGRKIIEDDLLLLSLPLPLDNSPNDNEKSSRHRSPKDFDGFSLTLLGDIHTYQTLYTPSNKN